MKKKLITGLTAAACCVGIPAWAADADADALEDVVVTATRATTATKTDTASCRF